MFTGSKKMLVVGVFAVVLILMVNLGWWLFYDRTENLLDLQLGRRLAAIASVTGVSLDAVMVESLTLDDIETYLYVSETLQQVRRADSLSEVFLLDESYRYLATTSLEADSFYYLAELNGPYIDSIFFTTPAPNVIVTPSYRTGRFYLRSAFVPVVDESGAVIAVLGVEASVDYFDALGDLRENLYYSTAVSVLGGLLFGLLFLWFQKRLNRAETMAFMNETHAWLGRMVAVVAHEIRNPLMIIRASAERLSKKSRGEETEFIVEEVDRLNSIVTGYLDFSRGGAGGMLTEGGPEKINLDDFLANIRRHFQDKYPDEKITWRKLEKSEAPVITGYPRALRQVLLNLLINAAEACRGDNRPIELGLSAHSRGENVVIKVEDSGPGMTRRDLKMAFEPFYTTRQTGSGLGLYQSRKIVVDLGGEIHIESKVGRGTTVMLTLPAKPGKK